MNWKNSVLEKEFIHDPIMIMPISFQTVDLQNSYITISTGGGNTGGINAYQVQTAQ